MRTTTIDSKLGIPRLVVALAAALTLGGAVSCGGGDDAAPCQGSSCSAAGSGGVGGSEGGTDAADSGGKAAASGSDGSAGAGGSLSFFDVWRAAQVALRKSPDHLTARADALVKVADPVALHAFVRDEIITYPPGNDSMYDAVSATRWGVKATLRGGAGTPREKADLLVDLYEKAGLEAQVVAGPLDPSKGDGKTLLLRETRRTFAPVADNATRASWLAVLKKASPAPGQPLDFGLSNTTALANSLLTLVPGLSSSFDFTLGDVPLVRVRVNGTWKFANPLVPGAAFGDSAVVGDPNPTSSAYPPATITISIEASRSDKPFDRFALVEAKYDVEQVVGRRINLVFSPAIPNAELPKATFGDVSTVIPVISVYGSDVTNEERDTLAHIGKPLSLGGDLFDIAPGGDVSVSGVSLGQGPSDPGSMASVQSLKLTVRGEGFRRIELRLAALSGSNKNVPGLRADAFQVLEDGKRVAAVVTQNDVGPPRVLLLHDVSTSLPAEFLGAGAVDFGSQIINTLYAKYSNAQVRVGVINFGVSYAPGGWATSKTDAQAQVNWLADAVGASEIYEAAAAAQEEKPTLIILVTDGDATDTLTAEFQAKLASGAPVLGIGVGTPKMDSLNAIAKLTGGLATTALDKPAAIHAAEAFIDARAAEDYIISYRAPKTGPANRQVTVNVDKGRLTATGSYDVPVTPAAERALAGVYLTIRVGDRELTRTLAGFESGYTTAYTPVSQEAIDDVQSLIFGRVTLSVEGAAVSISQWLDDWLFEKLTLEPAYQAVVGKDQSQIEAATKHGFNMTPPKLFELAGGLPESTTKDSLTFEHGPRLAAVVQKVRLGQGIRRQVDLFSKGLWHTAATDPNAAWQRTLRQSAYLATAEAALFNQSTRSLLATAPLTSFPAGSIHDIPSLDDAARLRWAALEDPFSPLEYALLAPGSGTSFAFWAVHTPTGTVMGVMPDGSGGALEDELNANLDATNHLLDLIGDVGSLVGADVGFWVELEKIKAAKLTAATIIIAGGQADIGDWPSEMANGICGAVQDGITSQIPGMEGYGNLQEAINQGGFWGGMGGINLPDISPDFCP